ncbi:hypothetical protein EVAR_28373_1 [Eumeta japonica]|uniref:Uncharacterized protein n=1 Tax=Eumeta variegata TaxID=151549 RepID=A0A4C1XG28_EUMVA|nr:hypothetical protein EVAR_28373_1 [Eumeta japonica]
MLDAIIPWQRNYKYLGVTLDKIYTSEIISSVLEILHFSTKQGSGPCSVEKVNYLDVINVPYTKCALGMMTYASPVFAHAQKHYIDYRTHRSDSSTSRDHIPMRSYARRLTIAAASHLIRRPRNVLTDPPDALTAAANDVNDTHD